MKIGEVDKNEVVAVAIEAHFSEWIDVEVLKGRDQALPPLPLCLETNVPVQVNEIAKDLSDTIIRLIPNSDCTSETIEGNFGMLTAITKYFDKSGEQASHLEIVKVSCLTTRECVVDIDSFGSGSRYWAERHQNVWTVTKHELRWVV